MNRPKLETLLAQINNDFHRYKQAEILSDYLLVRVKLLSNNNVLLTIENSESFRDFDSFQQRYLFDYPRLTDPVLIKTVGSSIEMNIIPKGSINRAKIFGSIYTEIITTNENFTYYQAKPRLWLFKQNVTITVPIDQWLSKLRNIIWQDVFRKGDQAESLCDVRIDGLIQSSSSSAIFHILEAKDVISPEVLKVYTNTSFDNLRSFYVECDITSRFEHPNLLKNTGFIISNELDCQTYAIKLPLASLNFKDRAKTPFAEYSVIQRISDIAGLFSALALLHNNGVVHYDLKDANIVFTAPPESTPKIDDFGSSQYIDQKDNFEPPYNSYYYNLMELDGKLHGRATDVLALGIVSLELLTSDLRLQSQRFPQFYDSPEKTLSFVTQKLSPLTLSDSQGKGLIDFFCSIFVSYDKRPRADKLVVAIQNILAPQSPGHKLDIGKVNNPTEVKLLKVDHDTKIVIPQVSNFRRCQFGSLVQYLYSQLQNINKENDALNVATALKFSSLLLDIDIQVDSKSTDMLMYYQKFQVQRPLFDRLVLLLNGRIIQNRVLTC